MACGLKQGCNGGLVCPRVIGSVSDDEILDHGMSASFSLTAGRPVTWCQSGYAAVCPLQLLFPEKDCRTALVKSFPGCISPIFIEKPDDFEPLFDDLLLGRILSIYAALHETTIAVSEVFFYILLLHIGSWLLPPWESNMFLNFCSLKVHDY